MNNIDPKKLVFGLIVLMTLPGVLLTKGLFIPVIIVLCVNTWLFLNYIAIIKMIKSERSFKYMFWAIQTASVLIGLAKLYVFKDSLIPAGLLLALFLYLFLFYEKVMLSALKS
ncbi:hypothetical protein [Pleionea mediterranea]|jgi:hypothetical protein|uniref:Uncharacterized protein n=1 Tax=Pleionea mediterranea TaxID=523701 RepID=A0A316FYR7_9GAMM|nr:hypothetical protein [Pleionea mediterranea]PWK53285.1 hypothetical protein C8D97_103112 [Pleionea mediterranea]